MNHEEKTRYWANERRNLGDNLLAILLFLQFLIAAGLSGAIFRHEISPWLWVEFAKVFRRSGGANAGFVAILYLIYYSFLLEFALWMRRLCRSGIRSIRAEWADDEVRTRRLIRESLIRGMGVLVAVAVMWVTGSMMPDSYGWLGTLYTLLFLAALGAIFKILEYWS